MIKFYIDMDGVLARWDTNDTIYDTFQPGYFLNRIPEPEVVKLAKMLRDNFEFVFILSSVYQNGYAEKEKTEWLEKYGIGDIPQVYVPYGEKKSDYTQSAHLPVEEYNILLDDFTKNLKEWESAGNLGFKFYNGINGTNGTWNGNCIHNRMGAETMYRVITSVGCKWAEEKEKMS